MLAIDPSEDTWEYICECDRGLSEDNQTVFVLKHLSPKEEARLEDALGQVDSDGGYKLNLGSQARLALDMGLKDVRNFKDSKGNDVSIQRSKKQLSGLYYPLEDKFLTRIPKAQRTELANAISKGPKLSEEDEKN
jgi:hypothetical protein